MQDVMQDVLMTITVLSGSVLICWGWSFLGERFARWVAGYPGSRVRERRAAGGQEAEIERAEQEPNKKPPDRPS